MKPLVLLSIDDSLALENNLILHNPRFFRHRVIQPLHRFIGFLFALADAFTVLLTTSASITPVKLMNEERITEISLESKNQPSQNKASAQMSAIIPVEEPV